MATNDDRTGRGVMQDGDEMTTADEACQAAARDLTYRLSRINPSDPGYDRTVACFGEMAEVLRECRPSTPWPSEPAS